MEEAAGRVRDLQSTGHLRGVVVGGGEGEVGCGPDCEESHQGICLVCNQGWGNHNGHQCNDGRRGSWVELENEDARERDEAGSESVGFITSLFGTVGQVPLPTARVAVFGGHTTLSEALRMSFWKLGVYVAEDDANLQSWCDQLPDWLSSSTTSAQEGK